MTSNAIGRWVASSIHRWQMTSASNARPSGNERCKGPSAGHDDDRRCCGVVRPHRLSPLMGSGHGAADFEVDDLFVVAAEFVKDVVGVFGELGGSGECGGFFVELDGVGDEFALVAVGVGDGGDVAVFS